MNKNEKEMIDVRGQPYSYIPQVLMSNRPKPKKTVLHQQTCPVCGRKLVNLYVGARGEWKCKQCWDEEASNE